jgi:hypothetical protein
VRRLLCYIIIASFALSLHASVPSVNRTAPLNHQANIQFGNTTQANPSLGITAVPADVSFYDQFYPGTTVRQEQPKTGMLHWVGNLIKKGRQKIALLSPQKFF